MKKTVIAIFFFVCVVNVFAQMRSFNDIFPNINIDARNAAFSDEGYFNASRRASGFSLVGTMRNAGIHPHIINMVMNKSPGYIVESITVIPITPGSVGLLDVYNALGNIRDLSGRLYDSATRGQPVPLFEEATRITSNTNTTAIPDPPPAWVLPQSETVYIRLKDANFGNTYYRGDLLTIQNGLVYTLTNYRNMTYLLIPVIKENGFTAQLYFEPINEGLLIYSIAGMDISEFFASMINISSAIEKRLAVIIKWAVDGIVRGR